MSARFGFLRFRNVLSNYFAVTSFALKDVRSNGSMEYAANGGYPAGMQLDQGFLAFRG